MSLWLAVFLLPDPYLKAGSLSVVQRQVRLPCWKSSRASRWETRHSSPGRWHRRCLRIPAQTGHFPPPGAYGYHRHKWCCQTGRTQTDKIWGGPTKRQRRTATTLRWPRQPLPEQCLGLSPAPGRGRRSGLDTFSYISDIGVLHCRTAAYFSKAGSAAGSLAVMCSRKIRSVS